MALFLDQETLGGLLYVWKIPTVCNGIPVTEYRADATDPCTAVSAAALMLLPGKFVPGVVTTVEGPCCCKQSDRKGCNEADTARKTIAIWPMMLGGKAETSRPVAAEGGGR